VRRGGLNWVGRMPQPGRLQSGRIHAVGDGSDGEGDTDFGI
jgi:hypothetical protein